MKPYVFVQAHRGYSSDYPEQTMRAFKEAVAAGSDRLEMDLSLTADDRIVLHHDNTLDRTTNGSGPVRAHSLEQLRQLDAGSWKHPQFANERIPTLEEVITQIPPPITLNLEIKVWKLEREEILATIQKSIEIVQSLDALDRVVFSSFAMEALMHVRTLVPQARLLLIDWFDPAVNDGLSQAIDAGLWAWTTRPQYAFPERIRRAAEAGLSTHVGGSGTGEQALRYIDAGISGLSGDDPVELIEFLSAHGFRDQRPNIQAVIDF
ncbi:MAG: glycerophosphodiester phosphodiesterase [Spirochaetaceae bacterium]